MGRIIDFSTPESLLDVDFAEPVYVVIDRIAVAADVRARLVDAVEQGYREAGEVIFETVPRDEEPVQRFRFSMRFECKNDGTRYDEPEPRLFSFNNPYGACPKCQGFGNTIDFDLNLVIPDKSLSLAEGAIEPWTKPKYKPLATEMRRYARAAGIPLDVPWQDLTPNSRTSSSRATTSGGACAVSSSTWSARNTSCTCASFSAVIVGIRCVPIAVACGCVGKRVR